MVLDVDSMLNAEVIKRIVCESVPSRHKQRELARHFRQEPDALTSGVPRGPKSLMLLIEGLINANARNVVRLRCARCQREAALSRLQRDGQRICASCADYQAKLRRKDTCGQCGHDRPLVLSDLQGRALCAQCAPRERARDSSAGLTQLLAATTGLDDTQLLDAVHTALPHPSQQRNILRELLLHPHLLSTNAALGSHRAVLLAQTLLNAGAKNVAAPRCAVCGKDKPLRWGRDGIRCCRRCYDAQKEQQCSLCGKQRPVTSRDPGGRPLCNVCTKNAAYNHCVCVQCGRSRAVAIHIKDGTLCRACWRGQVARCAVCGRQRPCHFADTNSPRCEPCSRKRRNCSQCGNYRAVQTRDSAGHPLCHTCGRRREPCSQCGRVAYVQGRTDDGAPICNTCWRKHPRAFRDCTRCGRHEFLHRLGLCTYCSAQQQLRTTIEGSSNGAAHVDVLTSAFSSAKGPALLDWLQRRRGAQVLKELVEQPQPITHALLDTLSPDSAVRALRMVLVAGGALPTRDEHLAAFELWLNRLTAQMPTEHGKLVTRYGKWHISRRLRAQSPRTAVTASQAQTARTLLTHARRFLAWLDAEHCPVHEVNQGRIDAYLLARPVSRQALRTFTRWTARNGYTPPVVVTAAEPIITRPRLDDDERWNLVRSILSDNKIGDADRLAALLILLYGQRLFDIVRLTTASLPKTQDVTVLSLGPTGVQLADPVATIAWAAVRDRNHHVKLTRPSSIEWIFPGAYPGTHLSSERLWTRMKAIGVEPRKGRNAALLDLAAQLPGAVFAELLGLKPQTAIRLNSEMSQQTSQYGAELARQHLK